MDLNCKTTSATMTASLIENSKRMATEVAAAEKVRAVYTLFNFSFLAMVRLTDLTARTRVGSSSNVVCPNNVSNPVDSCISERARGTCGANSRGSLNLISSDGRTGAIGSRGREGSGAGGRPFPLAKIDSETEGVQSISDGS